MVAHGRDDPCLCGLFDILRLNDGKVEIVALSLLPDIMRRVVSSPQNHIHIQFGQLLDEQAKGVEGQVAFFQAAPVVRWLVGGLFHR